MKLHSGKIADTDMLEKARAIIRKETGRFDGSDRAFNEVAEEIGQILQTRYDTKSRQSWLKTYQVIAKLIHDKRLHLSADTRQRVDANKLLLKYRMQAHDLLEQYGISLPPSSYQRRRVELRVCRMISAYENGKLSYTQFTERLAQLKDEQSPERNRFKNMSWQQFVDALL